jgi:hypothetical protein
MTPEISEFSYGFALTNEMVGWAPIAVAPLFPSLIEEGRAGGGYDVKLEMPGVPLYLQFKRADCMKTRGAREISTHNLKVSLPFYRFKITEARKSDQHELLLALDDGSCLVFYAAPRFHQIAEINDAWQKNLVATNSIFVAPSTIGALDAASHHVAYDQRRAWLCSDPHEIEFLSSGVLLQRLNSRIASDPRPFREKLPELVLNLHNAERRARARVSERARAEDAAAVYTSPDRAFRRASPDTPAIPAKVSRPLSETERQLREASDMAARLFDAQLIVVQPRS